MCLIPDTYRPRRADGKEGCFRKFCRNAQTVQGFNFSFDLFPVVQGIHIGILRFIIAGDFFAQADIVLGGTQLRFQIKPCRFLPETLYQLVVEQTVGEGDFGRGVPGDPTANSSGFCKNTVNAGILQHICAQKSRKTSADNQHICGFAFFQRFKAHRLRSF